MFKNIHPQTHVTDVENVHYFFLLHTLLFLFLYELTLLTMEPVSSRLKVSYLYDIAMCGKCGALSSRSQEVYVIEISCLVLGKPHKC